MVLPPTLYVSRLYLTGYLHFWVYCSDNPIPPHTLTQYLPSQH